MDQAGRRAPVKAVPVARPSRWVAGRSSIGQRRVQGRPDEGRECAASVPHPRASQARTGVLRGARDRGGRGAAVRLAGGEPEPDELGRAALPRDRGPRLAPAARAGPSRHARNPPSRGPPHPRGACRRAAAGSERQRERTEGQRVGRAGGCRLEPQRAGRGSRASHRARALCGDWRRAPTCQSGRAKSR
jgi:hypothetical protein